MSRGFPTQALARQDATRGLSGRVIEGIHYVLARTEGQWRWALKFADIACPGLPKAIRLCRHMREYGPGTLQSQTYRCDVCGKGYTDDFGREP